MKITRLYKPEDFTINQLYMFWDYGRLERGFCTGITKEKVIFEYNHKKFEKRYKAFCEDKPEYFAEYNSSVFRKFQKLKEYHEQEINDLLESNIFKRKDIENTQVEPKRNNVTSEQVQETIQIFGGLCFLGIICCFLYHIIIYLINVWKG